MINKALKLGILLFLVTAAVVLTFKVAATGGTAAGTPELSPELDALQSQSFVARQNQPYNDSQWSLVLSEVTTEAAWVDFSRDDEVYQEKILVGTMTEMADCEVAVLETHPGKTGNESGSTTGYIVAAVQCPAASSDQQTPDETGTGD